jgi:hypothetical protein
MNGLMGSVAALALLMASALVSGADDAWQPFVAFDLPAQSNWQAAYRDFGRPVGDTPAAKIDPDSAADDAVRMRDPMRVSGQAGYYLYDMDAGQAAVSGPIVGPLRQRTYSQLGADANGASLNRLTMGSESVRRDSGSSRWRGTWSSPSWSF